MRARSMVIVAVLALEGCPHASGPALVPDAVGANGGGTASLAAREHAGGTDEGPRGPLLPVSHSELLAGLAQDQIDPAHLGTLEGMDPDKQQEIMQSFTDALGVRCTFCHVRGNMAAPTPRKAVTEVMWNDFVHGLRFQDGATLYCDSCHHGHATFLPRDHRGAVVQYMEGNYDGRLARIDGQTHGCGTCHGSPINYRFLPRL